MKTISIKDLVDFKRKGVNSLTIILYKKNSNMYSRLWIK